MKNSKLKSIYRENKTERHIAVYGGDGADYLEIPVRIELGSNIVSQIKILKSLNINLKQLKNEIQFIPNKILLSKRIILFSNGQKHYRYKWEKL